MDDSVALIASDGRFRPKRNVSGDNARPISPPAPPRLRVGRESPDLWTGHFDLWERSQFPDSFAQSRTRTVVVNEQVVISVPRHEACSTNDGAIDERHRELLGSEVSTPLEQHGNDVLEESVG